MSHGVTPRLPMTLAEARTVYANERRAYLKRRAQRGPSEDERIIAEVHARLNAEEREASGDIPLVFGTPQSPTRQIVRRREVRFCEARCGRRIARHNKTGLCVGCGMKAKRAAREAAPTPARLPVLPPPPALVCIRAGCGEPITWWTPGRGHRPSFCSKACQRAVGAERKRQQRIRERAAQPERPKYVARDIGECAAPDCTSRVIWRGIGAPRRYCSATCSQRACRQRARAAERQRAA